MHFSFSFVCPNSGLPILIPLLGYNRERSLAIQPNDLAYRTNVSSSSFGPLSQNIFACHSFIIHWHVRYLMPLISLHVISLWQMCSQTSKLVSPASNMLSVSYQGQDYTLSSIASEARDGLKLWCNWTHYITRVQYSLHTLLSHRHCRWRAQYCAPGHDCSDGRAAQFPPQ